MARAPATATPILLGEAYKQYSKEDEDRTRKLIEQAIRDITNSTNTNNSIIQGGDFGSGFFPASGIFAEVTAAGDASHPAMLQILNPVGSGKLVKVYELYVSIVATGSTQAWRGRRVNSPVDLTGHSGYTVANAIRMDEEDSTAFTLIVSGAVGGAIITEAQADFFGSGAVEGQDQWRPTVVRAPGAFPISIQAGEALEFTNVANGAGEKLRLWAVLNEELA